MNYNKHNAIVTAKTAIDLLAQSLKLNPTGHMLEGFAGACYGDCSVTELVTALKMKSADSADCDAWEITKTEWHKSIKLALELRLFRDKEELEEIRKEIANT